MNDYSIYASGYISRGQERLPTVSVEWNQNIKSLIVKVNDIVYPMLHGSKVCVADNGHWHFVDEDDRWVFPLRDDGTEDVDGLALRKAIFERGCDGTFKLPGVVYNRVLLIGNDAVSGQPVAAPNWSEDLTRTMQGMIHGADPRKCCEDLDRTMRDMYRDMEKVKKMWGMVRAASEQQSQPSSSHSNKRDIGAVDCPSEQRKKKVTALEEEAAEFNSSERAALEVLVALPHHQPSSSSSGLK